MAKFGLIGRNIDYSFSKTYFNDLFKKKGWSHSYTNFDLNTIDELEDVLEQESELVGFNVTIPYKEAVMQ